MDDRRRDEKKNTQTRKGKEKGKKLKQNKT